MIPDEATRTDGFQDALLTAAETVPLERALAPAGPTVLAGRAPEIVIIEPRRSRLLDLLPAIFSSDDFATRFLCIFEDVLDTVEERLDHLPYYFAPATAPPAILEQLAAWVALRGEGQGWPEAARRILIERAVPIYGVRGTRQSLEWHLEALTGTPPLIQENTDGFRLGDDARLGVNTMLGQERPNTITITVLTPQPLPPHQLEDILAAEVPVGVQHRVRTISL